MGHVNVRLHLRHEVDATLWMGLGLGGVGWGMLTFACTCVDGARCYAPLGRMHKMIVRQCNHSAGIFSINRRISGRGWVKIHTGGIDS